MTDDDKIDDIEIVNAVMQIKNFVYRERMMKKTILEFNKKVKNHHPQPTLPPIVDNIWSYFNPTPINRVNNAISNTYRPTYKWLCGMVVWVDLGQLV